MVIVIVALFSMSNLPKGDISLGIEPVYLVSLPNYYDGYVGSNLKNFYNNQLKIRE